jgi:hypothetical protein
MGSGWLEILEGAHRRIRVTGLEFTSGASKFDFVNSTGSVVFENSPSAALEFRNFNSDREFAAILRIYARAKTRVCAQDAESTSKTKVFG